MIAKGSLFLGRMTQLSDGCSFLVDRNDVKLANLKSNLSAEVKCSKEKKSSPSANATVCPDPVIAECLKVPAMKLFSKPPSALFEPPQAR